jgi:hypothetical protein
VLNLSVALEGRRRDVVHYYSDYSVSGQLIYYLADPADRRMVSPMHCLMTEVSVDRSTTMAVEHENAVDKLAALKHVTRAFAML